MPDEETKDEKPTEEKTAPAPPSEEPEPEEDPLPQIDEALQGRIVAVQERFLKRDVTLGALADAGVISEFMFNICDNASTAKAIKEVCGVMNIDVDDFFATFGYDPEGEDEEEDEEGEEEDGDEPDEEPEPPAPAPVPKKRKSALLDNNELVK